MGGRLFHEKFEREWFFELVNERQNDVNKIGFPYSTSSICLSVLKSCFHGSRKVGTQFEGELYILTVVGHFLNLICPWNSRQVKQRGQWFLCRTW